MKRYALHAVSIHQSNRTAMIIDTREIVNRFAYDIRVGAILGAFALKAIEGDKDDDISENEAYRKYGKTWVKKRVEDQQIHFQRVGDGETSTKFYSVFEIETLKMAEKQLEQVYQTALIEQENMKRNDNRPIM